MRVSDLYFEVRLDETLSRAQILVAASVEGYASDLTFTLSQGASLQSTQTVHVAKSQATHTFTIDKPKLWYPARYGEQPLYSITAILDGKESTKVTKSCGIRKVELVQDPLHGQPGTSFYFRVNDVPIFCGGSNWIPTDSFNPRTTKDKYREWVKLALDGNQSMLRVWGGGIYEDEAFYDACDDMGILVWQDFAFACGNYPAHQDFLDSVRQEAVANVKLLRHHPCLVLLAGNNEDYQYREAENLTYEPGDQDPQSWLETDFPARYIYEKLLADVCAQLVPHIPYRPGCPFGGETTRDATIGDIHQWNVWHGTQEPYQNFGHLSGRFVSEFGMQGFPSITTIDAMLPEGRTDPDRFAQSSTMDFHNKAAGHERKLAAYMSENIRFSTKPLEAYIYATQIMQAECLSAAYRAWKRLWKGPGQEFCSGALVWQLNDCWPAISWSIVDINLRPKAAYYAMKRELANVTLGMQRLASAQVEIWACNLSLDEPTVDLVVKAFQVSTGREIFSQTIRNDLVLRKNRSTELTKMDLPVAMNDDTSAAQVVVVAYLYRQGVHLARCVNWPEPLKYLHLQKPEQLRVRYSKHSHRVTVSSDVPLKGLMLEVENESAKFDDNLVDVVPGEILDIGVSGLRRGDEIKWRYLNMEFM